MVPDMVNTLHSMTVIIHGKIQDNLRKVITLFMTKFNKSTRIHGFIIGLRNTVCTILAGN